MLYLVVLYLPTSQQSSDSNPGVAPTTDYQTLAGGRGGPLQGGGGAQISNLGVQATITSCEIDTIVYDILLITIWLGESVYKSQCPFVCCCVFVLVCLCVCVLGVTLYLIHIETSSQKHVTCNM